MAIAEGVVKKGDTVVTPDGEGKVTSVDSRFVTVELKGGTVGKFEPKNLNVGKGK